LDICFYHVCNADEVLPAVLQAGRVGRNTTLWGLLDLCALILVIATGVATYSASFNLSVAFGVLLANSTIAELAKGGN